MSESFRSSPPEQPWSTSGTAGNGYQSGFESKDSGSGAGNDAGRAVLVGVLGGLLSAAGYLIYQRLPEDQKQRLAGQARQLLQQRITELRQNFNI
ncbi:MAG: hypothetical protein JO311_02960 [Candidatus Eremiobacteraeota bacterium]|nr:hypothetical protein [Candidatus Eremiobacteraeota bacterium]MBV9263332.1 hypothetical protein [Candidatus Eremiobacteraeota bacterium]